MRNVCFVLAIISILFAHSTAHAESGTLWKLADRTGVIKVFVYQPINESGQGFIADSLKKAIESALRNRKSVKFQVVETPAESDVEVEILIKKFMYMERGPLKPTPSIGTTLLDAAATVTENYAEVTADFIVKEAKTGTILWKDILNPYLKRKMQPMESIPLISDKVASHFVWKCFGKPSK
jgi:hypothetical protein